MISPKQLGRLTAFVGLLGAVGLFAHDQPLAVVSMLRASGIGLIAVALAHVLPMLANARDWQTLLLTTSRPRFATMLYFVWLRESVNNLLPVARIGGEILSFRLLRRNGVAASNALASLVVDTQLTLISQLMFTLIGIAFLMAHHDSAHARLVRDLLWGVIVLAPLLIVFAMLHRANPFERVTRAVNRATRGKLAILTGHTQDIDRSMKDIWQDKGVVLRYLFFWQPLQSIATALEIWLALQFLGTQVSFAEAIVIESLIQAVSSAAFFVPGGLGIQEGGFVVIGGALGLAPAECLALAATRRVRDVLIFLPGLIGWQLSERSSSAVSAPVSEVQR